MNRTEQKPEKRPMSANSPARACTQGRHELGLKSYRKSTNTIKGQKDTDKGMVQIHPEGHIPDTRDDWDGFKDVFGYIDRVNILPENKELLKRFCRDAKLGKTIKKGVKKKVGPKRLAKYVQDLKKLDHYLKKPLDQVTQEDLELFITDLEDGNIESKKGRAFADETQVCIKKIVRKFYSWLLTGSKYVPDLVDWIDTSYKIKDGDYIKKDDLDLILTTLTSTTPEKLLRNRALLAFFFDSGARIDELYNVRFKHLELTDGNYRVRLEYSKTKARTISLPLCKEYLDAWLDIHPARNEPLAQVFPMTQNGIRKVTKRAGRFINHPRLIPHTLRKSSATYWANKLSRYQLCARFGWSMSSRQPDRYINIAGLDENKIIEAVETEKYHQVKEQNAQLTERMAAIEDVLHQLLANDKAELQKIVARVMGSTPRN